MILTPITMTQDLIDMYELHDVAEVGQEYQVRYNGYEELLEFPRFENGALVKTSDCMCWARYSGECCCLCNDWED